MPAGALFFVVNAALLRMKTLAEGINEFNQP